MDFAFLALLAIPIIWLIIAKNLWPINITIPEMAIQTRLVDTKRVYNTALGTFWTGMFMEMAGYPILNTGFRGDADDYAIISTSRAQKTFEEGKEDGPIKLR